MPSSIAPRTSFGSTLPTIGKPNSFVPKLPTSKLGSDTVLPAGSVQSIDPLKRVRFPVLSVIGPVVLTVRALVSTRISTLFDTGTSFSPLSLIVPLAM